MEDCDSLILKESKQLEELFLNQILNLENQMKDIKIVEEDEK